MRGIERIGDLDRQASKNFRLQRAPGDAVLQRQPIQILHGDERLTVLLADVIDRADIGMVQGGSGLRLTLETGQSLGVAGDFIRQEFERDKAMQA